MDTKVVVAVPERLNSDSNKGENTKTSKECTDRANGDKSPQSNSEGQVSKTQSVPETRLVNSYHEDKAHYAAQLQQLDREAFFTFGAALLVTLVFWFSIYCTHDSSLQFLSLPLWFVLSCIGGYLFSVVVVVGLTRFLLKPCELNVAPVSAVQYEASSVTEAAADAQAADAQAASAGAGPAGAASALSDKAKKLNEVRG